MNRSRNTLLAAAGFCGLLALPAIGVAEDKAARSIEELAAESATTPAQHQALAAYYREKATRARREVTRYRAMPIGFNGRSPGAEAGVRATYDRLAEAAKKAAIQADSIAAFHDAEAKKAGQ